MFVPDHLGRRAARANGAGPPPIRERAAETRLRGEEMSLAEANVRVEV